MKRWEEGGEHKSQPFQERAGKIKVQKADFPCASVSLMGFCGNGLEQWRFSAAGCHPLARCNLDGAFQIGFSRPEILL